MSLPRAIITPATADTYVEWDDAWAALSLTEKEIHIARACMYFWAEWVCPYVLEDAAGEGEDAADVYQEAAEALSYYALADLRGDLYPQTNSREQTWSASETVNNTTGDPTDTMSTEYSESRTDGERDISGDLSYPDQMMMLGSCVQRTVKVRRT